MLNVICESYSLLTTDSHKSPRGERHIKVATSKRNVSKVQVQVSLSVARDLRVD
jgi:hypothetical protein